MSPFPSATHSKPEPSLIINIPVYCSCRMPFVLKHLTKKQVPKDENIGTIHCDLCNNWYHHPCVKLSNVELKKLSKPNVIWWCIFKRFSDYVDDILKSNYDYKYAVVNCYFHAHMQTYMARASY